MPKNGGLYSTVRRKIRVIKNNKETPVSVGHKKKIPRRCGLAQDFMPDKGEGEVDIFRIDDDQPVPINKEHHGIFFGGDCYIVKYSSSSSTKVKYILYCWQGKKTSSEERAAAMKINRKMDVELGRNSFQIRILQGEESAHFVRIFKGNMVTFMAGKGRGFLSMRNYDGYNPKTSRLFQLLGTSEEDMRAVQVPDRSKSLNSNDTFLLDTSTATYLWVGARVTEKEKEIAEFMRGFITPDRELTIIREDDEPSGFWKALGGRGEFNYKADSTEYEIPTPKLIHCRLQRGGELVLEEIISFTQQDLHVDDIFLLDVAEEIYIWVGQEASVEEKEAEVKFAEVYLKKKFRRTKAVFIIVKQGSEPKHFTKNFPKWSNDYWKNLVTYEEMRQRIRSAK